MVSASRCRSRGARRRPSTPVHIRSACLKRSFVKRCLLPSRGPRSSYRNPYPNQPCPNPRPNPVERRHVERSRSTFTSGSSSWCSLRPCLKALYCHCTNRSLYLAFSCRSRSFSAITRRRRCSGTRSSPAAAVSLRNPALRASNAALIFSWRASVCLLGRIDSCPAISFISCFHVSFMPAGHPSNNDTICATCDVHKCFPIFDSGNQPANLGR